MVVLSAAVCNDEGKVLVSRQFVSMTRLRIEGLLSAFPKLLGNENVADVKQHTFVETDEVRYVYQPMDSLYVLLVTNKTSNIIKDLKTLRLLAKLVPEYCEGGHDEEAVNENSFELIFAFDEVVSLGYAESVDIGQIKNFTTMDSHEEKLTRIIQESKKSEAKEHAKKRAREIAEEKKKMASMGSVAVSSISSANQFGSDYGNSGGDNNNNNFGSSYTENNNTGSRGYSPPERDEPSEPTKKKKKKSKGGSGFSLKSAKSKPNKGVFDDLIEDELKTLGSSATAVIKNTAVEETNYDSPEPVKISLEEKCSITCERDGALKKFDVAGSLVLTISDPSYSKVKIGYEKNGPSETQYRAFPKIDKGQFKKNVLAMKDSSQGFPVGSNSKTAILKWKLRSTDEKYLPLQINFWPSEEGDSTVITVDYSADNLENMTLQNVVLTIPGIDEKPKVTDITGDSNYDRSENEFQWFIGTVESGDSGNLEIICSECDDDDQYFPLQINFTAESLYSGIEISSVENIEDGEDVDFVVKNELFVNKFHIEA